MAHTATCGRGRATEPSAAPRRRRVINHFTLFTLYPLFSHQFVDSELGTQPSQRKNIMLIQIPPEGNHDTGHFDRRKKYCLILLMLETKFEGYAYKVTPFIY